MSQLACPLCGRFVSLNVFDPSHFESDIYAVNRTGLGRGRGFAVSESYSVLGESTITGPIAERCRIILGLIEGRKIPSRDEQSYLRDVEKWRGEAMKRSRSMEDLTVRLVEQEEKTMFWMKKASTLRRDREEYAALSAESEDEVRKLRRSVNSLEATVARLKIELNNGYEEVNDEDELLAEEEMQMLLDRINFNVNGAFSTLSEAVDFLMEII